MPRVLPPRPWRVMAFPSGRAAPVSRVHVVWSWWRQARHCPQRGGVVNSPQVAVRKAGDVVRRRSLLSTPIAYLLMQAGAGGRGGPCMRLLRPARKQAPSARVLQSSSPPTLRESPLSVPEPAPCCRQRLPSRCRRPASLPPAPGPSPPAPTVSFSFSCALHLSKHRKPVDLPSWRTPSRLR